MKPLPKVEQRLLRQAVQTVATAEGRHWSEIEDEYSYTRTALVHYHIDDWFVMCPLDKVDDLLRLGAKFMRLARASHFWSETRLDRLEEASDDMLAAAKEAARKMEVTPEHIRIFIAVVEETYRQYQIAKYDVDGVVKPEILMLAHEIQANFEEYKPSLNYTMPEKYATR